MTTRQTRPVFNRLPIRGYQDNPVADALTSFYDEKLVAVGSQVEQLHTKLDPVVAPSSYLNWLAFLVGMVHPYYSVSWADSVKRLAIANANSIFSNRGTLAGLGLAMSIHGFEYSLYTSDDLRLAFTFTATTKFGIIFQTAFIRLPLRYARGSYEFVEATKAVTNYTAIVTPTRVVYDAFYLGFSVFDDPLF